MKDKKKKFDQIKTSYIFELIFVISGII